MSKKYLVYFRVSRNLQRVLEEDNRRSTVLEFQTTLTEFKYTRPCQTKLSTLQAGPIFLCAYISPRIPTMNVLLEWQISHACPSSEFSFCALQHHYRERAGRQQL